MKLNLILTSVLTFLIVITQAQQRSCATMDVYQNQIENNSNFLIKQQNLEQMTEYYNNMLPLMNNSEEVYTIPVVIHVLYKTSSENISDEQVYSQMTSLNDDFRALNNDLSSLPSNFEPLVSDMQIEFCLAQVDPNGNSTSGINRVSTNQNSFSYNNNMKFSSSGGVDAWDTDSYLNIWVCNLNNLLGYAQFPGGDASTDGVVVANTAFGSTGIAQAPYNLGRTLTHEIGHWLNLRHIWGDSNCGNDFVDDTPTHQEANYGCPNYPQESCNNGPDGDLFMNYMDYTNDACMYMFTTGQRTRMTSALLNSRSSLLNSTACSIGAIVGCTDSNAANYNPDATQDDNSCEYPCLANEVTLNILSDCYPEETSWELLDQDGILLESSSDYSDLSQTQIIESFCLEDGCYTLKMMDSYGDGLNGSIWSCNTDGDYSMTDTDNNILFEMQEVDFGNSITHEFCFSSAPIFGCTDATADNFNPEATQEDLSCTYCDNFSAVLISSNDATSDNPSGGSIQATGQGGSSNYSLTVYDIDGNIQNPFELQEGTYNAIVNDNEFGCSETISVSIGLIIIQVDGCTDPNASNYNPDATQDNNSCEYPCLANEVTFNILTDCYPEETSWELFDQDGVLIESSPDYSNSSQTNIIESFCLEDGCYTLQISDSYGDGLNGSIWSCSVDGDYSMTDTDNNILFEMQEVDFGNSITHEFCFSSAPIFGCTDATADNFNPEATQEDLSCTYCDNFSAVLISSNDATSDNPSGGSIQATGQGGSSNYSLTVYDIDGNIQNPFELQEGTYNAIVNDNEFGCSETISVSIGLIIIQDEACDIVPTGLYVDNIIHDRIVFNWSTPSSLPSHYMIRYRATGTNNWTVITAGSINDNQYNGTSRTRYFMEPLTSYQWSIRARVLNEDGTTECQSSWSPISNYTTLPLCANLENLSTSSEANWVTLMADAPSPNWGVWQSKGKMREVGTNSYRYVSGASNGINFLKGNFDANTDYEWQTKAWCTGNVDSNGDSDPMYHSGWGEFSGFTTEANCSASPTNLSTISGNGANTALTMSWNSPQSGNPDHYFLELTNESTSQIWAWNNIAGNSNSKTKYGLTNGHNYSWRIRGACGTNGTSWATSFTAPAYYTLGGQRMASPITNLKVYPNPSKGMISINFESQESQNVEISITNYLGEKVFKQEVSNLINTYNRTIDLSDKANGIYLLSIKTNNKIFNKKIVIQ